MKRLLATLFLSSTLTACAATMPDQIGFLDEATVPAMTSAPLAETATLTRIGFGSCLKEEDDQSIWTTILAEDPDLFLFIGDNVYGDPWRDDPEALDPMMPKMVRSYTKLASIPEFTEFRNATPLLTTWDDHDYGVNDGGAEFPFRERAEDLYNDAWAVPADDERRMRPGIHTSKTYGPDGQRVQIILLDTRYFRGPLTKTDEWNAPGKERYIPSEDTSSTMLGDAQWAWLEAELQEPADLRLLVSSVQVHSDAHGWEAWRVLPHERERLYAMLDSTGAAEDTIILSGDRHAGSIYRRNAGDTPVLEVTSSSLNAPVSFWKNQAIERGEAPRPPEQGPFQLYPMQDEVNYGLIDINWDTREATLSVVSPGLAPYVETKRF